MRDARRAGIYDAASATATSDTATAMKVSGSELVTPARSVVTSLPTITAATIPTRDAGEHDARAVADDHVGEVSRASAECHADANLLGAPGHGIRQHAIEPQAGEQEREDPERDAR